MAKSKTALIVPLTQRSAPAMRQAMLDALSAGADLVECRLDYLASCTNQELRTLLAGAPLPVIATCRAAREGGLWQGEESRRLDVLREAAALGARYVDIEMDVPPQQWPQADVIISHHDFASCPADLSAILERMHNTPAAVVKIAYTARGPEDAIRALAAVRGSRKPALVLAMGEAGVSSRILAGKFGAFGTFASLEAGQESAPGQVSIEQMKQVYRWDAIGPATAVYGVIGCPVGHSMSPAIHNAAFAAADLDGVYLPLRIEPAEDDFRRFMTAVRDNPWAGFAGFSVTIPHKEHALAFVGNENVDDLSRQIGAVNTIAISPQGQCRGTNTDYPGATDALVEAMGISRQDLSGRNVSLLGAGGAARALVAALRHYGAHVTIFNRTAERAQKLAREFGAAAAPTSELPQAQADILINCTSVGMHPDIASMPLEPTVLKALQDRAAGKLVVFDTIYNPIRTRLLDEASRLSCRCVSGVEMFVNQAVEQFRFWTGRQPDRQRMRDVVLQRLGERA